MLGFRSADDRLKEAKPFNCVILAPNGVGKTTLATHLPAEETLLINIESGLSSIGRHNLTDFDITNSCKEFNKGGGTFNGEPLHPWIMTQILACAILGPTPGEPDSSIYSSASYENIKEFFKAVMGVDITTFFDKFKYIFVDSISDLSTLCYQYQENFWEGRFTKKGEIDTRGIYGQVGIELESLISKLQKCENKSIILAMKHNLKKDDVGRDYWKPEMKGAIGYEACKGLFDCVWALQIFNPNESEKESYKDYLCKDGIYRCLVTSKDNQYLLEDVKTRGVDFNGCPPLNTYEIPNLYKVLNKLIKSEKELAK